MGSVSNGVTGIFHWYNPSGHTMAVGSTQLVQKMSTRNISWGLRRPVCRADNLTTFMCRLSWNLGSWTSWNPQDLSRPVLGLLCLYLSYVTTLKKKSVLITLCQRTSIFSCITLNILQNDPHLTVCTILCFFCFAFLIILSFYLVRSLALWFAAVVLPLRCRILWNMYSHAVDTLLTELQVSCSQI
jgi:hypothetical protein